MLLSLLFCITGTITTAIYTLSLHDALPISVGRALGWTFDAFDFVPALEVDGASDDHQGDDISVEAIADSNPDWILVMDRDAAVSADDPSYEPAAEILEASDADRKSTRLNSSHVA